MAKIVFICYRNGRTDPNFSEKISLLTTRLTPSNISVPHSKELSKNGIDIAIMNPRDSLPIRETSVCMGHLLDHRADWWKPGDSIPDGSYALFRTDETYVELVSDVTASRTIWYLKTDTFFIASTSQRAIVFFAQDFELNRHAVSWMLCSGSLGPGHAWDARINCLPPDSRLILNRRSWQTSLSTESIQFEPTEMPETQYNTLLRQALEDTLDRFTLDINKWLLPLSGGYDSRVILLFLIRKGKPQCVTWGTKAALNDVHGDACVAQRIARHFDCNHLFLEIGGASEPIDIVLERFLKVGEGRIDHLSGYVDGLRIWQYLHETGYQGLVRGDIAFGFLPCKTAKHVYSKLNLMMLKEYSDTRSITTIIDDYSQERPPHLERREGESLATWRDRIHQQYFRPTVLAALSDVKLSYTEIINPLLSRTIINYVRKMPDHLRTGKQLYKNIVKSMSPDITFAKNPAIVPLDAILGTLEFADVIRNEIASNDGKSLFPRRLIDFMFKNMRSSGKSLVKDQNLIDNAAGVFHLRKIRT